MQKLTESEEQAMAAVWKTGEGTVKNFLDAIADPQLPYTTLASTVKNLEKKKYLSSRMVGNTYVYTAKISKLLYKQKFMHNTVKELFDNSYQELVNFFVDQKKLTRAELQQIVDMIERKEIKK